MTLKSKTISGFKWSFIDTIFRYFLTFFVSIILARILSPSDYGLIGIVGVFMAFSRVFIDGGFSDALIRKVDCTIDDYSSVFIFNLALAAFFYIFLFFAAPAISVFFNENQLTDLVRVAGIGLLLGATASVNSVILKKSINFRLLAIIGFAATLVSGIVSVTMAFNGFGVWSLVWSSLLQSAFSSVLLWFNNNASIKLIFKKNIIKEHFSFGSKIMFGSFIHAVYGNMYYVLIGKIYSPALLGYYTRADNFQKLFSDNIDIIVRQVTYPVLSQLQGDATKLKETYQILIRFTAFASFVVLLGLFAVAKPFTVTLIGEKWLPSVPYLQLLCFAGILAPLISINTNVLNVKGRSDLSLKIVIIKVFLAIPALILGYYYGIYMMIIGALIAMVIIYVVVMYYSNLIIGYSIMEQLKDLFPTILLATIALTPTYIVGYFSTWSNGTTLLIQVVSGILMLIFVAELLKNREYLMIKNMLIKNIKKTDNKNES
jgi:O-antigen/teichoic acid export membrane protein